MTVEQPDLPSEVEWPEQTKRWWKALPSTPGADQWTESDWEYLMTTALVHAAVWGNGDFTLLGELRTREAACRITPAARKTAIKTEDEQQEAHKTTPLDMIAQRRTEMQSGKKTQRRARA